MNSFYKKCILFEKENCLFKFSFYFSFFFLEQKKMKNALCIFFLFLRFLTIILLLFIFFSKCFQFDIITFFLSYFNILETENYFISHKSIIYVNHFFFLNKIQILFLKILFFFFILEYLNTWKKKS